jgi:hypothetical protein
MLDKGSSAGDLDLRQLADDRGKSCIGKMGHFS